MSRRGTARLAWGLLTITVCLVAAMCVFYVLGTSIPLEDRDRPPLAFLPVMALLIMAFGTVGALVASRRPRNAIGWIFCAVGILGGIGFAGQFYADWALIAESGSLAGGPLALWLSTWTIVPFLTAMTIFALLFPDGRLLSSRWRPAPWLAGGAGVLLALGMALAPGTLDETNYPGVRNPYGLEGAERLLEALETAGTGVALLALLLAVISIIIRLRRSVGVERQQLKWVVFACALSATAFVVNLPLTGTDALRDALFVVAFLSLVGVPVATGAAILRYRLYEIDRIVNRTVVYALVTVGLTGLYFGIVLALQQIFSGFAGGSDLAIAGSTLAVAALFRPARSRIQALVDRRFYRRRYDSRRTLETFSTRLRDEIDLNALVGELRGVVQETMQPAHVSLWLREQGGR